jgi:hypothetical protein
MNRVAEAHRYQVHMCGKGTSEGRSIRDIGGYGETAVGMGVRQKTQREPKSISLYRALSIRLALP